MSLSPPPRPESVLLNSLPQIVLFELVAGADQGSGGEYQTQVLDIGTERVVDDRKHQVRAFAGKLRHDVSGSDPIRVIVPAADQGVAAVAAVQRVVAAGA